MIALAPGGRLLDDALVDELAAEPALTLLCGRYEGFDERIVEHFCSDVVSIGRYVLSGGELAAMVVCDAVMRKLPGALGDERSAVEESFSAALEGAPEYPHYTRPAEHRGWRVPEVLLSGHHARIEEWRRARSRERGPARAPPSSGPRPAPGGDAALAGRPLPLPAAPAGNPPEVRPPVIRRHLFHRHEQRHRNHRARAAAPRPRLRARATASRSTSR